MADPTPPRDVAIFKKEIKRNKKEIKFETPRAPRVLIFRKFLSYIQKRNNWKNLDKDETSCARWRFTIFLWGIILNYIIWYKVGNVKLRKMILKKEITQQTQCYQGFLRKIKEITKISKTANA